MTDCETHDAAAEEAEGEEVDTDCTGTTGGASDHCIKEELHCLEKYHCKDDEGGGCTHGEKVMKDGEQVWLTSEQATTEDCTPES